MSIFRYRVECIAVTYKASNLTQGTKDLPKTTKVTVSCGQFKSTVELELWATAKVEGVETLLCQKSNLGLTIAECDETNIAGGASFEFRIKYDDAINSNVMQTFEVKNVPVDGLKLQKGRVQVQVVKVPVMHEAPEDTARRRQRVLQLQYNASKALKP